MFLTIAYGGIDIKMTHTRKQYTLLEYTHPSRTSFSHIHRMCSLTSSEAVRSNYWRRHMFCSFSWICE